MADGVMVLMMVSININQQTMLDKNSVTLIKVRNPWGFADQFTGKWSKFSDLWQQVSENVKDEFTKSAGNAAFWYIRIQKLCWNAT